MARSQGQKLKLLYLMKMLIEQSDIDHPLTIADIISQLELQGISAERKSIYDDISALRDFGLDIEYTKTMPSGYYLAQRQFALAEVKLLADSVISSKFITVKKTKQLLTKLSKLCSQHEANLLKRDIIIPDRIKSMNESIYYNVDFIHENINLDQCLSFKYITYTKRKSKSYRHNGKRYEVSPFALVRDNENYYMIAYDLQAEQIKHFRVDRMDQILPIEQARVGEEQFRELDMSRYTTENFSMFHGLDEKVSIQFKDSMIDLALDRFGRDTEILPVDDGHFMIRVNVAISPQFYAWILALGGDAVIVEPASVRTGLMQQVEQFIEAQRQL